ncbi:histidine kinase [Mucilaginibacter sp. UR6-1]|uniref:sensor histidine kinase n=1 Tax=Mucilaginibacter sp. UR6-1 TaxID=1435643 RepID=UPI001E31D5FB|nr:histidine kinase [Mucilaginibacter sp. UR6-1]MCC8409984.1 histidine kinase [Mucilaginibacter sp. UR6-1]
MAKGVNLSALAGNRWVQHGAFWLAVSSFFVMMYSFKSTWQIALHNNVFFMPVHIALFYAIGYWLIPRYLLTGKYVQFGLLLILTNIILGLTSRFVDIVIAYPYLAKHYLGKFNDPYDGEPLSKLFLHPVYFFNAFKSLNLVACFGIGVKYFKMWHERKQAALKAELDALKGQLHPHFLFNTLNNLYSLTLQNSPKSSNAVLGLSEMLRYMLYECNTDLVSLSNEVSMLKHYTDLEQLRYEERLDLTFNITGNLDGLYIAPLLLLPFIENTFKHGASEKLGHNWININLSVNGNVLKIKASNSKPEQVKSNADRHFGNIGLQNVKKRLELLYPRQHSLKILDDDEAFLIVLELTLIRRQQAIPTAQPHENTYTYS